MAVLQCERHRKAANAAGPPDGCDTKANSAHPAAVGFPDSTMTLLDWLRSGRTPDHAGRWRQDWERAVARLDRESAEDLRRRLAAAPPLGADVEVEEEMMAALDEAIALAAQLAAGRVPSVETSHRVIAGERCHFSAPVSIPDDPAQPSGRLLFTPARAVFVGGSRVLSVPWHTVRQRVRAGRDLVLVRGATSAVTFRCNTYTDAVCADMLASHLAPQQ